MSLHPRIAAYLGLQGLLILAWWAGLHASPDFRALFLPTGGAWAASILMLPAMLLTLGSALLHTRSSAAHAPARRSA